MKRFIASLICVLVIAGLVLTPVSAQQTHHLLEGVCPKHLRENNKAWSYPGVR